MNDEFLLLSLGTASFGFIIWYILSSSLRLPKSFQIQYDINEPYVNRIYRRRLIMFILYALIPYLLIAKREILGPNVSLSDLGIHFTWNMDATLIIAVAVPLLFIYHMFSSGKDYNLVEYPEIRVTNWTKTIFILSAITWIFQIFAMEFLFRGLLLQSLMGCGLNGVFATIISTGLYAMTHYFKRNRISFFSIPFGLLACTIVIYTNSIIPVIIIHLANTYFSEWFSIRKHPEIKIT